MAKSSMDAATGSKPEAGAPETNRDFSGALAWARPEVIPIVFDLLPASQRKQVAPSPFR